MLLPPVNVVRLPLCTLSPRLQRRVVQCTAIMPSALRHQPHSWSDDPGDLPALHDEVIQVGPAALNSMIKVSRQLTLWQADPDLGMLRQVLSVVHHDALSNLSEPILCLHRVLMRVTQSVNQLQGVLLCMYTQLLASPLLKHILCRIDHRLLCSSLNGALQRVTGSQGGQNIQAWQELPMHTSTCMRA